MARRIGIYSGTFDPVHAGHIAFAAAAREACQLDEVVFLPEKTPRGKQNVTDISHRVALLEKAIEATPELKVATLGSPQFTVSRTLPELQALFDNAELTLLAGSDVARSLAQWPDASVLLEEMSLVIGMRAGDTRAEIEEALPPFVHTSNILFVETNFSDVTSSRIRSGAIAHFNVATAKYISQHALYSN